MTQRECWVVYDMRGHVPVIAGRTREEAMDKIQLVNVDLRHHYYVRPFVAPLDVEPTQRQYQAFHTVMDAAGRWAKLVEDPKIVESIANVKLFMDRIKQLVRVGAP